MPEDSLSSRIRQARAELGLSQQELADRVRVSQPTIVHWEQGTHTPRHLALARLADALSVSRQWLLGAAGSGAAMPQVQGGGAARASHTDLPRQPRTGEAATAPGLPPALLRYLASPTRHVPVIAWPQARSVQTGASAPQASGPSGAVAAALDGLGPVEELVAWSGPVLRPLGLEVQDPAVRQTFAPGSIAVLDCAPSETTRPRDGSWYLLEAAGQPLVRRFRQSGGQGGVQISVQSGSFGGRFEADSPRDMLEPGAQLILLGRIAGMLRRFDGIDLAG
jgi:transcriptional regulator with XRE-family HTH domain